ncbi:MAG: cation:proton antiporter, partial [Chloroflexota bacterium]|nr:cation:proton antiporter [Chloroflexota bacterium]
LQAVSIGRPGTLGRRSARMTTGLVANLALALVAALLGALLARWLRLSAIVGYVAAGVAIGPFTPGYVADPRAVEELADLGLVFLLFTIGAELSLRDLMRAGRVALLGASVQVLVSVGLGLAAGLALGWTPAAGIVLGAGTAMSSGAVLGKVLADRGELEAEHGRLALAWSTVQDLATIGLVVLLPALAAGRPARAEQVLLALGKAALFLALLVPLGVRVFPLLFERLAELRNRELFVLAVAAVAIGTAFASTFFGVSLALGAFVAGLAVGESDLSHQVLAEVAPLRDVLAGLFFVSIGILVDPPFVAAKWPLMLLALVLMVVCKGLLVAALAAALGAVGRTASLLGVTMAQCGEFTFLLARLGRETGAVTAEGFNVILSGAAASIVLAPALHDATGRAVRVVERRLSERALASQPDEGDAPARRHAVICGYGDVGQLVGEALARRGFSYLAIDQDPRVVRRLRETGVPALLGSADNPVLLDRAGLDRARVLVVALPDALATRQVVDYARRGWPRLDIVVRTHSTEEMRGLRSRGVNEAVSGELELALEMARHTLRRFGVSSAETLVILQGFRSRSGAITET